MKKFNSPQTKCEEKIKKIYRAIGLMSGTSMDGIDAALIETDGTPNYIKPISHISLSYDAPFKLLLKASEYAIKQSRGNLTKANADYETHISHYLKNSLHLTPTQISPILKKFSNTDLAQTTQQSTYLHSVSVRLLLEHADLSADQIHIIGYHGQAMFHQPNDKISIILGDGQALSNILNIPVINNFRNQDIAMGGQGAPFAPIYHQALAVRDNKIPLAIVNCGGISNITIIAGEDPNDPNHLIGFDTGPGNGLIDTLVRQRTYGAEYMDKDGQYGKRGAVNPTVLQALYNKSIIKNNTNYFSMNPPKSLDYGDLTLIPELDSLSLEDACRTLEAFTADSIIQSVLKLSTQPPKYWVLSGGGWHNPVILEEIKNRLRKQLGDTTIIQTADEVGWNSAAMEAELFAYLAVRSLQKFPISFPNTTGVKQPLSGGSYFEPCLS